MNKGPSASLVARIRDVIIETFDISSEQAHEQAYGLAALAEGWGGEDVQHHDWAYIAKKKLGDAFPWRNNVGRKAFSSERDAAIRSYERYIQQNNRA